MQIEKCKKLHHMHTKEVRKCWLEKNRQRGTRNSETKKFNNLLISARKKKMKKIEIEIGLWRCKKSNQKTRREN